MKELRVFIISPSDVEVERDIAKRVCNAINYVTADNIKITPVLWEYHPMDYLNDPQANIDNMLEKADIFIVILWNRIGSVIEGYKGFVTNSNKVTGTQYEIEKIISLKKQNIFFFFKQKEKHLNNEEVKQKVRLIEFLEKINLKKGTTKHSYQEFKEPKEFSKKLINTLTITIEKLTKTKITKDPNEYISFYEINPNYYAGLYVSMVILILMLFFYAKDTPTINYTIKETIFIFSSLMLFINLLGIKSLPLEPKVYPDAPLTKVFKKLFLRASFMIVLSTITAIFFALFIVPSIRNLFGL